MSRCNGAGKSGHACFSGLIQSWLLLQGTERSLRVWRTHFSYLLLLVPLLLLNVHYSSVLGALSKGCISAGPDAIQTLSKEVLIAVDVLKTADVGRISSRAKKPREQVCNSNSDSTWMPGQQIFASHWWNLCFLRNVNELLLFADKHVTLYTMTAQCYCLCGGDNPGTWDSS